MGREIEIDIEEVMRIAKPELDKLAIKGLVPQIVAFLMGWRRVCKERTACTICAMKVICPLSNGCSSRPYPGNWTDKDIWKTARKMAKLIVEGEA